MKSFLSFRSATCPAFAAAFLVAAIVPALAQNNVTLENLKLPAGASKSELSLARVDVVNTNLSRDEVARFFSSDLKSADALGLAARMSADKITIRGAGLAGDEAELTFGVFTAEGLNKGRFRKATLDGFTGAFKDAGKPVGSVVSKAIELENGNLGPLIAAAQANDLEGAALQLGRFSWAGFEASFADADVQANAPGGNLVKVSLAALNGVTEYDGDIPRKASGEARGLVIEPPKASGFAMGLKAFGYDKLEFGFTGSARYDSAARVLVLEDYTLSGVNAGKLGMAGTFTNIAPELLTEQDMAKKAAAGLDVGIAEIKAKFVNDGLVEKGIAFAAAQQGKSPAAFKAETAAMSAQLLPLLLGGDPSALALAQSVQSFINDPRSFNLTLKARGVPLPAARLAEINDPAKFLALVDVTLKANQ